MEIFDLSNWVALVSILLFVFLVKFTFSQPWTSKNLPPSPPSLPVIGHLHLLKQPMHRILHRLSNEYGDILLLQFGTRKVLVVSSLAAVEECFTKNDLVFADRPSILAGKHLNYNSTTMGFASYGDHWRSLRRLTTIELFSTSRVAMFANIRADEVRLFIKQLFRDSRVGPAKVDLTSKLMDLTLNNIMRMAAGRRFYGSDGKDEDGELLQDIIKEMESLRGSSNLNDYFPVLQWIDYKGVEKRMKKLGRKMDRFLQKLIDEHNLSQSPRVDDTGSGNQKRKLTLVDVMLSLKKTEPEFYTDQTIKGVMLTTLTAGSQTSAATLEWALSLLLNNPETMQKAYAEIEAVVGSNRLLDETDLQNLSYLQNIITETLRLFPPAPLLLPHKSSQECTVSGYHVPRGTTLLVNTWSMNRNPKLWEEPEKFKPERFEGKATEGYKLLPFGAGRRACPGAGVAKQMVGLTLGTLIQCFEWQRVSEDEIDLTEQTGLTMPKAVPLVAICKPQKNIVNLLLAL